MEIMEKGKIDDIKECVMCFS